MFKVYSASNNDWNHSFKSPVTWFGFCHWNLVIPRSRTLKCSRWIVITQSLQDEIALVVNTAVLNAATKDFSSNYSGLSLKSDSTLKSGQINDSAVAVSIVSIQSSHMFLWIYNPPSTSPYRIEANILADWIYSCHATFDNIVPNFFFILGDLNLNDVCWATLTGHSDYSKSFLPQTQQIILKPLVFEPTYKSGSALDS